MASKHIPVRGEKKRFFGSGVLEVIKSLPERTRDILSDRYNLFGKHPKGKTLDAIGKRYGITRERVRQIVQFAMKSARDRGTSDVDEAVRRVEAILMDRGGIFARERLVSDLGISDPAEAGALDFVLDFSDRFVPISPDRYALQSVSLAEFDRAVFHAVVETLEEMFAETKKPKKLTAIRKHVKDALERELDAKHLEAYLVSSATMEHNPLGEWGLATWGEIRPRSAGERAYLVLRHAGEPLHFSEIAREIDNLKLSTRPANPQTVHNELIKSPKFALLGRGRYGLSEWKRARKA